MLQVRRIGAPSALVLAAVLAGCETDARLAQVGAAESCMRCHNGSQANDYAGPGLENPHPFGDAADLRCTTCHGGNGAGTTEEDSHVPPPPQIGDRENQITDRTAYFNKLTLTGIDKFPDYTVNGQTYTAIDYLQFLNPGDLRVTKAGRACGNCHQEHTEVVGNSLLATEAGILSGASYQMGVDNYVTTNQGLYQDTAADLAFRAAIDPDFAFDPNRVGAVPELLEHPVYSQFGVEGDDKLFRNNDYNAADLANDVNPDNSVISGSRLAHLYHEQAAFTCGDCHLGSAGANNRYGDFRSSGCTACHMPYSLDGRSRSRDPNVPKDEPFDPDDIDPPERAHVRAHRIVSTKKTLPNGIEIDGIDDHTCAGCHQGSNRTVMQYWGIRLDQNQDVRRGVQYPSNPDSYRTTSGDTRLFDPVVGNNTFNGRNRNQYLLEEDYDGDGRDDTPADVHHEAGMGCIDCHNSYDLHGGNVDNVGDNRILSRMEQAVAIRCESCHGTIDAYATTVAGTDRNGVPAAVAVDTVGNQLHHVVLENDGNHYLYSKLTGAKHYVSQTRDVVVDSGKVNPFTNEPVYSQRASYAMGRKDGDPNTGIGPQQATPDLDGFSHTDNMNCAACHSSWTNTCMGCHLEGEYNTNPNNHSNITGERIVFRERNADFVYQSPLFFQLGIGPDNKIRQLSPNTVTFFQYEDRQGNDSKTFAFTDRNGGGNNPAHPHPSLSHNAMMAHSIRGRVSDTQEGPRYCASCHLTNTGLTNFGLSNYQQFRADMAAGTYTSLNFTQLEQHFGTNTGNHLESPLWVHMVAGLGSGIFLFDEDGCPINPIDDDDDRKGCDDDETLPPDQRSPADRFLTDGYTKVAFNLDRIVTPSGVSTASNNHSLLDPLPPSPLLRDGATDPNMSGPLGAILLQRLSDPTLGIVLDSWLDTESMPQGAAGTHVTDPP